MPGDDTRRLVAIGAITAPALHSFTDLLELAGAFSPLQLWLNYVAFVSLPFVMLGLHAKQRPRAGILSLAGALCYGASFVYFAGTTTYAIVRQVPDYATLLSELGTTYTVHGGLMVVGGILFGTAVIRARVLPVWAGCALIAGVTVNLVVALGATAPLGHLAGTLIRNVALMGMGVSLLHRSDAHDARVG